MISKTNNVVAKLIPDYDNKHPTFKSFSGVSAEEMKALLNRERHAMAIWFLISMARPTAPLSRLSEEIIATPKEMSIALLLGET